MAGFFDYILGRDEYASDAPLDPTTGLRPADRRQAGINTLANVSQALMQIGAARNPREAAAAWGMFPTAAATGQTYLDALTKERRVLQQEQGLRNLMKDPEQLKSLGLNENQIGLMRFLPTETAAAFVAKAASADPLKARQAQALENLISNLSPEEQLLARANPQAYVTQMMAARKPEKAPEAYRLYQLAQKQNLAAGKPVQTFDEWEISRKEASAMKSIINMPGVENTVDAALAEQLAKKQADVLSQDLIDAASARSAIDDFNILEQVVKSIDSGPFKGRLMAAIPGYSSDAAVFESIVKRIAPTQRAEGSGSTSDIEYAGMLSALPQLVNRREANLVILEAAREKAKINLERGDIIYSWQMGEITGKEFRQKMRDLNQKSIMTPKLRGYLNEVSPSTSGSSLSREERMKLFLEKYPPGQSR